MVPAEVFFDIDTPRPLLSWAKDRSHFVYGIRTLLERSEVSARLPKWIDNVRSAQHGHRHLKLFDKPHPARKPFHAPMADTTNPMEPRSKIRFAFTHNKRRAFLVPLILCDGAVMTTNITISTTSRAAIRSSIERHDPIVIWESRLYFF
jgi:hypothetical protein